MWLHTYFCSLMKKKSINVIIGLMCIALFGVMGMQYYFIRESYIQKSQLFDLSVKNSISEVTKKIAKQDAAAFVRRKAETQAVLKDSHERDRELREILSQKKAYEKRVKALKLKMIRQFRQRDSSIRTRFPRVMLIDNEFYDTYLKNPAEWSKVQFRIKMHQSIDANGQVYQNEEHELYAMDSSEKALSHSKKPVNRDTAYYLIEDPVQGLRVVFIPKTDLKIKKQIQEETAKFEAEQKARQLAEAKRKDARNINHFFNKMRVENRPALFEDLANEYEQFDIPLLNRINPVVVDTLLNSELAARGIRLSYNFRILSANSNSLLFVADKKDGFSEENTYSASLFPKEYSNDAGVLSVSFPAKQKYLIQNMNGVLASSSLLLLVMIGCFVFTIYTIFRQKKISEMKTDFINNMTHEFKTPVATIMIASEALKDPEISEDARRIQRLAGIIYDENVRLGNHIERVLNIARIDRGDLKLDFKDLEMNDLIAAIADSMHLQFERRQAELVLSLEAARDRINGDELHISNVIFNLIDNALKYSKESPYVAISTFNTGRYYVIRVADRGIGMNKDQLSRIFEQFYRIPTGNVHDVKGFGLGLSYVNDIVKRHKGHIKVKSEKDRGSEFEITIPLS